MLRWYIAMHDAFCHDGDVTMLQWYIAMHDATMAINDVTMLCFNTCRMLP